MARPARLLLASIHDVSPRFEGEVDRLLELLAPWLDSRLAMLVVPNHWGTAPIIPGSPFAGRLRQWAESGIEMFLHGFFHRDDSVHQAIAARTAAHFMTAGEGEFLALSRARAARRIADGRALLEDVTGQPIIGFVAPAWLYGSGALQALGEAAIPIAEDHFRIWSPARQSTLALGPVITWASRSRLRLSSSLAAAALLRHAPVEVLRIGVHPPDVHHPRLVRSIARAMDGAAAKREVARYSDLMAKVRT